MRRQVDIDTSEYVRMISLLFAVEIGIHTREEIMGNELAVRGGNLKLPAVEGKVIPPESELDRIEAMLQEGLRGNTGMRAPGVKDNLFRLSDYLNRKADVPPREVLLFLHAYIFALEHTNYYQGEEIKRLRKQPTDQEKIRKLLKRT